MKIVIIGGSHAGIAAAKYAKGLGQNHDIFLIEKGNVLGFIPSTINLVFQKMISPDEVNLGEITNENVLEDLGINVFLNSYVSNVDKENKKILIDSNNKNVPKQLEYDYLILAMGSEKFTILNSDSEPQLLTYKNKDKTLSALKTLNKSSRVGIIGAGLIGMELASSLSKNPNKQISIIEQMGKPLFRYFDTQITEILLDQIPQNVHFEFENNVTQIRTDDTTFELELLTRKKISVDTCVYAINPKPESNLVRDIIKIDFDNTIVVDHFMQTSNPFIYAIGDLVRIPFGPNDERAYLPLIANARRTAFIAVHNILSSIPKPMPSTQRTIGTELFGFFLGSTGLTKAECDFYGLNTTEICKTYNTFSKYHLPKDFTLTLKIIFDSDSRQLLGAQLITNRENIFEWINILSQMIFDNATVDDFPLSDIYYNPQLSPSINFLADIALDAIKI